MSNLDNQIKPDLANQSDKKKGGIKEFVDFLEQDTMDIDDNNFKGQIKKLKTIKYNAEHDLHSKQNKMLDELNKCYYKQQTRNTDIIVQDISIFGDLENQNGKKEEEKLPQNQISENKNLKNINQIDKSNQNKSLQNSLRTSKKIKDDDKKEKNSESQKIDFWTQFKKISNCQQISKNGDIIQQKDSENFEGLKLDVQYQQYKIDDQNTNAENLLKNENKLSSYLYIDKLTGDKYLTHYEIVSQKNDKIYQSTNVSLVFQKFEDIIKQDRNSKRDCGFFIKHSQQDYIKISKDINPQTLLLNGVIQQGRSQYYYQKTVDINIVKLKLYELQHQLPSQYEFLCEEPEKSEKSTTFINHPNYEIQLPLEFGQNFDMCFLQDATLENLNDESGNQNKFLDRQYILLKNLDKTKLETELLIYCLKRPQQPFLWYKNGGFQYKVGDIEMFKIEKKEEIQDQANTQPTVVKTMAEFFDIKEEDPTDIKKHIIKDTTMGFFTQRNQDLVVFSLFSLTNIYQISVNLVDKQEPIWLLNYDTINLKNKMSFFRGANYRILNPNIDIFFAPVDMNKIQPTLNQKEPSNQSFFYSGNGDIVLIYPIQNTNDIPNLDVSEYQLVQKEVETFRGVKESGVKFYINNKIIYQKPDNLIDYIYYLKKQESLKGKDIQSITCTEDMIFCSSKQDYADIFTIDTLERNPQFFQFKKQNCQQTQHNFLDQIIKNFDISDESKRSIYQNNYQFNNQKMNCNQYLNNFYIDRYKAKVLTTHNVAYIYQEDQSNSKIKINNKNIFEFDESYLLINLSQDDTYSDPFFSLIKLYDRKVTNVKLLKYHRSQSTAIFFFIHRELNDDEEQQGVHFFVIYSLDDLRNKVYWDKSQLLNKDTIIYVPFSLKQIYKIKYSKEILKKFEDNTKFKLGSSTQLDFEMVRDLGDPSSDYFPYIYYDWVQKEEIGFEQYGISKFEQYLCFINIEKIHKDLKDKYQNDLEQKIDFEDYIKHFKIDYYRGQEEPSTFEKCKETDVNYRNSILSLRDRSTNLFSRSSNWEVNLFEQKMHSTTISAKFKVGAFVKIEHSQFLDIKEILVTINIDEEQKLIQDIQKEGKQNSQSGDRYLDEQNKIVYKDKQHANILKKSMTIKQKTIKEINDQQDYETKEILNKRKQKIKITDEKIRILQVQQIIALKSQNSTNNLIENDRIIPYINDDGQISSSLYLMNEQILDKGIYRINFKDEEELRFLYFDDIETSISFIQKEIDKAVKEGPGDIQKIKEMFDKIHDKDLKEEELKKILEDVKNFLNKVKDAEDNIKLIQEQFDLIYKIKNLNGQLVQAAQKQSDYLSCYDKEGNFINKIYYPIIQEYANKEKLQNIDETKLQLLKNLTEEFSQEKQIEFLYSIINLNDIINNKNGESKQIIKGDIVNQSINQLYLMDQIKNKLFICQTHLSPNIIKNQYFNEIESQYWLYYYSQLLISTAMIDFRELYAAQRSKQIDRYFQPRMIFNANNFCSIDFKNGFYQLSNSALSIQLQQQNQFAFIEHSPLYDTSISNDAKFPVQFQNIINSLGILQFYNLQFDFQKCQSIIQYTIDKDKKTASSIIELILNDSSQNKSFNNMMMQDFPLLVTSNKVNIIKFLNLEVKKDENLEESTEIEQIKQKSKTVKQMNNLEQVFRHHELPQIGEDQTVVRTIDKFNVPFLTKDEICIKVMEKIEQEYDEEEDGNQAQELQDEKALSDVADSQLVNLEFSSINFDQIIRKIKIDKIINEELKTKQKLNKNDKNIQQDEKEKIDQNIKNQQKMFQYQTYLHKIKGSIQDIDQVDDLFLADLIQSQVDNKEFMDSGTIQKIILYQYQGDRQCTVQQFVKYLLLTYLFGFLLPFMYQIYDSYIYHKNEDGENDFLKPIRPILGGTSFVLSISTQLLFFYFEFADITYNGFYDYISNGWNMIDFTHFFFFSAHIIIRLIDFSELQQFGYLKIFDSLLQASLLVQGSSKVLQFIRYDEKYSMLVQMMTQVFKDVIPFLTVFLLYVTIFSVLNVIIESDFDSDGYDQVPRFFVMLFSNFRIGIGDMQVAQYGKWDDKDDGTDDFKSAQQVVIVIIWTIWFINVFGMMIVLMNFLVAEVGVTFENVTSEGSTLLYKEKANFNLLVFQIWKFLGYENKFSLIILQQNKQFLEKGENEDQNANLTEIIKNNTSDMLSQMKQETVKLIVSLVGKSNQDSGSQLKDSMMELNRNLSDNKQKLEESKNQQKQMEIQFNNTARELNQKFDQINEEMNTVLAQQEILGQETSQATQQFEKRQKSYEERQAKLENDQQILHQDQQILKQDQEQLKDDNNKLDKNKIDFKEEQENKIKQTNDNIIKKNKDFEEEQKRRLEEIERQIKLKQSQMQTLRKLVCNQQHPLFWTTQKIHDYANYFCDICKKKDISLANDGGFCCKICRFDVCKDCRKTQFEPDQPQPLPVAPVIPQVQVQIQVQEEEKKVEIPIQPQRQEQHSKLKCPKHHSMIKHENKQHSSCDLCRQKLAERPCASCKDCDYDLCNKCQDTIDNYKLNDEQKQFVVDTLYNFMVQARNQISANNSLLNCQVDLDKNQLQNLNLQPQTVIDIIQNLQQIFGGDSFQEVNYCKQNHQLIKRIGSQYLSGRSNCDLCRNTIEKDTLQYCCKSCGFDVCQFCIASINKIPIPDNQKSFFMNLFVQRTFNDKEEFQINENQLKDLNIQFEDLNEIVGNMINHFNQNFNQIKDEFENIVEKSSEFYDESQYKCNNGHRMLKEKQKNNCKFCQKKHEFISHQCDKCQFEICGQCVDNIFDYNSFNEKQQLFIFNLLNNHQNNNHQEPSLLNINDENLKELDISKSQIEDIIQRINEDLQQE